MILDRVGSLVALMIIASPAHSTVDAKAIDNAKLLERTLRCAVLSARVNTNERQHELQKSAMSIAEEFESAAQEKLDPYDAVFWERVPVNVGAAWFGSSTVLKLKRLRILIASDLTFEIPRSRDTSKKTAQIVYREEGCGLLPRPTE